jgi:hypothetical protein
LIINPQATLLDIKDAINERMAKVKALTTHFLESVINCNKENDGFDKDCVENILSTINDFLEEIDFLYQRLSSMV